MSRRFDISQLVRIAISDEGSGVQFYKEMSTRAKDVGLKQKFLWLSGQEVRHRERFEKMLKDLELLPQPEQYPDEYVDYLEILVAQRGRGEIGQEIEDCRTDLELISLGINFEQEQLSLQKEVADVLNGRHKEVIKAIIEEERAHIVTLSNLKKSVR